MDVYDERLTLLEEFRRLTEAMDQALEGEEDALFLEALEQREEVIRQLDENERDLPPDQPPGEQFRDLISGLKALDRQVSEKLNKRVAGMRGQMKDYQAELSSLRNLKRLAKSYSITVQDDKGFFVDRKK